VAGILKAHHRLTAHQIGLAGELAGPGDGVAEGLADIGLAVRAIDPGSISAATLAEYDAILVGIRAFNVDPSLHSHLPALLDWVAAGGVLLVQYQTNSRIGPLAGNIGPAALESLREAIAHDDLTQVGVLELAS
jgi:hypothetical protein